MAIRRSNNIINQMRVDAPHMRSIESAVRSDFDDLLKGFVLGEDKSLIIRGLEIEMSGAIGGAASGLELIVENSSFLHGKSDEAGTFYTIPSGESNEPINSTTNPKVDGDFTPSSLNYVGIEFSRGIDSDTVGQVYLFNPTANIEITKNLPLAITLGYKIIVSSTLFDANVMPIAVVETDSSNNVISIEDRRELLFRLGSAGENTPNPYYEYGWDNHAEGRSENFYKSTNSTSPFRGGDKQILSFKENDEAIKTELKLLKGTTYWYSGNPSGSISSLRADLAHTQVSGAGKISHSAATAGQMNWDADIYLDFIGSRLSYKIASNSVSGDIVLSDNQVAYINLVRGVDIAPNLIFTNASAIVTSVGSASWTTAVIAGDFIKLKTADDTKYYQILSVDSAFQVTLADNYSEVSTGISGTEAQYAIGTYSTNPTPSTNRHVYVADRKNVPFDADTYWLFLRTDKGGSVAKVFMRGSSGGEIEQGESIQISDNTSLEILQYIGSPSENDSTPDYTNAIATYLPEITEYTFGPASGMTSGQSFEINSASNAEKFYVWANIASAGNNPLIPGRTAIQVALTGSENAIQVATAFHNAINSSSYFNSTDNLDGSITVENSQLGECDDSINVDMAGLSIAIIQDGIGKANCVIIDDENLTKSIKRLDEKVCDILGSLDGEPYREKIVVVSGSPANDNEIQGAVAIDTFITLPLNSHNSNVQVEYEVGSDTLEVFYNGHLMSNGNDYVEVGTLGDMSIVIQIKIPLEIGEDLEFRFREGGSAGGGGTSSASGLNLGVASNADVFKQVVGQQFQFRRLTAGSGVTITQGVNDIAISSTPAVAPLSVYHTAANYSMQSTDNVILVTNAGADVTITLPSATASGKRIIVKKIDVGNIMYIKTIGGQLLDGVDRDASPLPITIAYEAVDMVCDGINWYII